MEKKRKKTKPTGKTDVISSLPAALLEKIRETRKDPSMQGGLKRVNGFRLFEPGYVLKPNEQLTYAKINGLMHRVVILKEK
jgi:hypothetical protein